MSWEKELEQILANRVLDITDEYKGVKIPGGVQVYGDYPAVLIKELSDFIAQQRAKVVDELVEKAKGKAELQVNYMVAIHDLEAIAEEMQQ